MEKYISYKIQVSDEEQSIVLALLSDIGFESFIEESNSLEAFISESDYKVHKEIIDHYFSDNSYQFMINNHDPKDWNKLWESNFDDIIIKDNDKRQKPQRGDKNGIWDRTSCHYISNYGLDGGC